MSDERRGPFSRARALLERVVETVRGPRSEPHAVAAPPRVSDPAPPPEELDPLADTGFEGVRIDDGALVFRVGAAARARAEALLGEPGTPTLRVVRIAWRETLDVAIHDIAVHAEGVHGLGPLPDGEHEVCALGLAAGRRFVSLHHLRR